MDSRFRFRLAGMLIAALLIVSPLLGSRSVAAQSSSADAQALLDQAQELSADGEAMLDERTLTLEQSDAQIGGEFLNTLGDLVADFYLEFAVTAPDDIEESPFDFGVEFRGKENAGGDYEDYRLVFVSESRGNGGPGWFLTDLEQTFDAGQIDDSVFEVEAGATYDIVVAAIGDEAAFSVNGEPITVLDVSEYSEPGDGFVGTGFFLDFTVDGREIEFSDVAFYSLDEPADNTTTNDDDEDTNTRDDETPTPDDGDSTTGDEGTYLSPSYQYTLEYGDDWELSPDAAGMSNPDTGIDFTNIGLDLFNADYVGLENGVSRVAIYGGESNSTPEECVQSDIATFEEGEQYDFFSIAKGSDDGDLEGDLGDGYYAVIWVTDNGTADDPIEPGVDTTIYIECRPFANDYMLLIEHFAPDADYNDEIAAREDLLSGLDLSNAGIPLAQEEETPAGDDETPPATDTSTDSFSITLDAVGASGVEGDAEISASGTTRSTIDVVAPDAPEGTLVIIQEGSCDDLSGTADFDAGALDENGESSERVRITPDDLDGNYALTLVDAETEDYAEPLACGDIG